MQTNLMPAREHSPLIASALVAAALLIAGCGQGDDAVDVDVPDPDDGREAVEVPTPEDERRGYDEPAGVPTPEDTETSEEGAVLTPEPGMMEEAAGAGEPLLVARSELEPTEGNEARGQVTFSRAAGAVVIDGELMGLTPGLHALHIHEKGDCSAPDATSAGGHFAPGGDPHGSPDSPPGQHHVGDLGNVEANEEGYALVNVVDAEMTLDDGPKSVLGRALIVHAGADDFETQPTGAAGSRVACGVIAEVPRADPPDPM